MQREPTAADLDQIEAEDGTAADPLESLFEEAQAATAALPPQRKRSPRTDAALRHALNSTAKRMQETYLLEENWERVRGVALVHRESGTLIGNYSEFRHRWVAGCRRLRREHSPILLACTEYVTGDCWLEEHFREHLQAAQTWTAKREACLDLLLPEFGLGAPAVLVTAFLSFGGIVRVELAAHTTFASAGGETFLTLPANTNVLEVMGLDSKLALRAELAL